MFYVFLYMIKTLVIKLTEYNFTPTKTGLSSDRQSGSGCEA